jgi:serine protease AprX
VMAGLIAGNGAASGGLYPGIAPKANIVSVKVAGRNGVTDVSQILAGLQWIGTFAAQDNIKVVSLAWGSPSTQSSLVDPLDFAVERLWSLGITVVVSGGNAGPGPMTITKPGDDPAVITVGAYNDNGTADNSDDATLDFSSRGPTADDVAKPDVIAPGRTLIATRSPGSLVEEQNPQALVAGGYIRGSGTSEATAVTAGGIALILGRNPSWTPDQVKYALTSTAHQISGAAASYQGAGEIKLNRAPWASVGNAPVQDLEATGLGSLEASRGGVHVSAICPGDSTATVIQGEMDVLCQAWDGDQWSTEAWTGDQWSGDQWSGDQWSGDQWSGDQWSGDQWSGDQWSGDQWSGDQWSGNSWDPAPVAARGRAWRS